MKTLSELTWTEIEEGIMEAWKNTNEKDSSSLGVVCWYFFDKYGWENRINEEWYEDFETLSNIYIYLFKKRVEDSFLDK